MEAAFCRPTDSIELTRLKTAPKPLPLSIRTPTLTYRDPRPEERLSPAIVESKRRLSPLKGVKLFPLKIAEGHPLELCDLWVFRSLGW
ncbi:hypothetical protein AVEN_197923-1 [Araneus ventricosus]|uniref:Uncharacterized protein n=1 Tax=Araneus ventricosus TaxID=182803 RepID=A0A4Y2CJK2_ARAVE|nr:hypothetical protein AVEN_197923-1 [Araneus ventricosus]